MPRDEKRRGKKAKPVKGNMPDREQILAVLREADGKVGKREIARALGLKGGARVDLKHLLREMTEEGCLVGNRKAVKPRGALAAVTPLAITGRDDNGDLVAEPIEWDESEGPRPRVIVGSARASRRAEVVAPGVGDRILARITRHGSSLDQPADTPRYEAVVLK
ncbi:MAG TPA: ribonuclease R, partial [Hyphomicrobiaceae bacterium]|nr:ribonuclease R [Hyphomicrobiaceae bacterium]